MYINRETRDFILRLKTNKITSGIKYKDVAKGIGISTDFLYHVLAGDRNLPEKYWAPLEQYLDNFEAEHDINIKIVVEKIGGQKDD